MWLTTETPEAFNYESYASVRCGAMWEANEFPEVFGYAGWLFIRYAAMWLVSNVCEAFSYVGWQVASGMNLYVANKWDSCGMLLYEVGQESCMKLCGQYFMLYVIRE